MFKHINIEEQLQQLQRKGSGGDKLVSDAQRILKEDLFTDKKILDNLLAYSRTNEVADEEDLENGTVFTLEEMKRICTIYRLKFLDSKKVRSEIPYEAVLRIKSHNLRFRKALKEFKVLAPAEAFTHKNAPVTALLFTKTNYDNYHLIHSWGGQLKAYRKIKYWPMRKFENLFLTIILFTLTLTLSLPTEWITLDSHAEYWSGYRAAAFFHLLIFNMGVTTYFTFAFAKNFSSTVWNREQDFG